MRVCTLLDELFRAGSSYSNKAATGTDRAHFPHWPAMDCTLSRVGAWAGAWTGDEAPHTSKEEKRQAKLCEGLSKQES